MKRYGSDGKNSKSNKILIKNKECPYCHHDRVWISRGEISPTYLEKCAKCGRKIR